MHFYLTLRSGEHLVADKIEALPQIVRGLDLTAGGARNPSVASSGVPPHLLDDAAAVKCHTGVPTGHRNRPCRGVQCHDNVLYFAIEAVQVVRE